MSNRKDMNINAVKNRIQLMSDLSEREPEQPKAKPATKPKGKAEDLTKDGEEKRNKAISFMLRPSLVEAFRKEAHRQERSANQLAEEIFTEYLNKRRQQ